MIMPGVDGHELILAIRQTCPYMDTVLMSGALAPDDRRFRNYPFIAKPFTRQELVARVKEILGGQIH